MKFVGFGIEECLEDVWADQPVDECRTVHAEAVGEVVNAVEGNDGLYRVARERGHRRNVRARRIAGDRDEFGINAVLACVLTQPGHGAIRIVDVVRIGCARTQAVIGVGADPAERGEMIAERQPLLALVAENPCAAMDVHEPRPLAALRRAAVDVHGENASVPPGEGHVAQDRDAIAHTREWPEQQAPRNALDVVEFQFGRDALGDRCRAQARQPQHEQERARSERQEHGQLAGPAFESAQQRKTGGDRERQANVEQREIEREESDRPARQQRYGPSQRPCRIDDDCRAGKGNQQE